MTAVGAIWSERGRGIEAVPEARGAMLAVLDLTEQTIPQDDRKLIAAVILLGCVDGQFTTVGWASQFSPFADGESQLCRT